MRKGKVQLKRIENKINRQVTFSKRRSGLLKKAHEISILCDVELALIIFSSRGKLYEFSSENCMDRILERYEKYRVAERAVLVNESRTQENFLHEYGYLQNNHLLGKKLDTLSLKELQQLEQQLETSLKQIRSQMNHQLLDSIAELQAKENSLLEQKTLLKEKIIESENILKELQQMTPNEQSQALASSSTPPTVSYINIGTFYLECNSQKCPSGV
nr:MADS-box protein 10 [Erycina pusilla]